MITDQLIKQLTNQQQFSKIYKLQLSNRLLKDINGLRNLHKLRYLELNYNSIKSIHNLSSLTDLRELHLANNQLTQIRGLESNKNLTVLDLSHNRIKKIQNISHLFKLQCLKISNNCLEKISGMQGLKDLKKIYIDNNYLPSIDSLPIFSKLQVLSAQNNKINQLSPKIFQKSTKLIHLNLSHNSLKDMLFVHNLPSLQYLNLEDNLITQMPSSTDQKILYLKYLQYLNVGSNRLENLVRISETFPQLTVFLIDNNMIASEYEIISSLAGCDYLIEINFLNNPMYTTQFEQTLFQLYNFDRINGKDFSKKPGTKYSELSRDITRQLAKYTEIEDDQDDRKIKMSGFYSEQLQTQITGMKPNRPSSPARKSKAVMNLNYQDFQKAYHDIKDNDNKIDMLRNQCKMIFEKNGIDIPSCPVLVEKQEQYSQQYTTNIQNKDTNNGQTQQEVSDNILFTEIKMQKGKDKKVLEMKKVNQQQAKKWKQLKNKDKNFNIRGVVRRGVSGSQRKTGVLNDSAHKLPSQEISRDNLMRTQINPPRWNNDPNLMKTLGYRPLSAKKKMT